MGGGGGGRLVCSDGGTLGYGEEFGLGKKEM